MTAAGAFIKIPVPPAPITLQFMFTAFAGILLGPVYGALSQLVYVALGLAGLPIFTAGGGITYVLQPSFGFLIGMIGSAYVIGKVYNRLGTGFLRIAAACLAGAAVLYLIGLPYMYLVLHYYTGSPVTLGQAVWSGFILYRPGELIKIALTSLACMRVLPALKAQGILETSAGK
jgi:biotin transport system substrate-specific component